MEYASDQPSAADYASADAQRAQSATAKLEKRVARIEKYLGIPPMPDIDPIEQAKIDDARRNGRKYP